MQHSLRIVNCLKLLCLYNVIIASLFEKKSKKIIKMFCLFFPINSLFGLHPMQDIRVFDSFFSTAC